MTAADGSKRSGDPAVAMIRPLPPEYYPRDQFSVELRHRSIAHIHDRDFAVA